MGIGTALAAATRQKTTGQKNAGQQTRAHNGPENILAPRGWNAARDLAAIGNPHLSAAAVEAWQAAQGWTDEAVMRCAPHWDAGCTASINAWSTLTHSVADGIAGNPATAWLAGPTMPNPLMPSFPTRPLQFLAYTAGGLAPVIWNVWQGTTGMDAGLALGCLDLPRRSSAAETLLGAYEPMIDAVAAGAFAHALLEQYLLVLATPAIWTDGRRLHRADGPALAWRWTKIYAWKGVVVPERVIMRQDEINPRTIQTEANQEIRRTMIDIYGLGRYLHDTKAVMIQEDETGRLWRLQPQHDAAGHRPRQRDDIVAVEVENGTIEPDGSRKTYWLNVPPHMTTAKEAVSWSYALTPEQYDGLAVRT
jgi:hypothetical protein